MVSNRATHDTRRFGTICIIFKKEKHPWRNATFSKPATLRKVSLPHECFRPFLNCTNGTKSRKVSHMIKTSTNCLNLLRRGVNLVLTIAQLCSAKV